MIKMSDSSLILMNMDGNIVKRYRFDPWGNLEAQWGTEPNHYLFTGKEKDESGLYYFGARYYNLRLGRWITPEPRCHPNNLKLKDPQSLNPYSYCRNNPLAFVDPDGQTWRRVGTNEPIKTVQELVDLTVLTALAAQKGERPMLPFYFDPSTEYHIGPRGVLPVSNFIYGKEQKTTEGRLYRLIFVKAALAVIDIPIKEAQPVVIGKTKEGEDVIELEFGGYLIRNKKVVKSERLIIQFQGTLTELNELFNPYGWEIINVGGEYILQPLPEKEEQ